MKMKYFYFVIALFITNLFIFFLKKTSFESSSLDELDLLVVDDDRLRRSTRFGGRVMPARWLIG